MNEVAPVFPESARGLVKDKRMVLLRVSLDANGNLSNAIVAQSSGQSSIDASALDAVRATSYSPELHNCVAIGGEYSISETVDPNGSNATPRPTPTPACDTEAFVVHVFAPEFPDSARRTLRARVTVLLQADINANGKLIGAAVYRSSGNHDIDNEGLRSVTLSEYSPKRKNCIAERGLYIFRAAFDPNS